MDGRSTFTPLKYRLHGNGFRDQVKSKSEVISDRPTVIKDQSFRCEFIEKVTLRRLERAKQTK